MTPSLTVDLTRFNLLMQRMVKELRLDAGQVLRHQSKLLGQRLIAFMPPRSKAIGLHSVEQAVQAVAYYPDEAKARSRWLKLAIQQYARRRDHERFKGAIKHTALGRSNPIVEPFHGSHHALARSRQDYTPAKTVNRISLNKTDITRYVRRLQAKVGLLKSRWTLLVTFGGGTVASWINRHPVTLSLVKIVGSGDDQSITVINPGVGVRRFGRHVRDAIRSRERDMQKSIEVQLRLMKKKADL